MKCMSPLDGNTVCPVCGFDPSGDEISPVQLRPGTLLQRNRYLIGKALGQGGFGITYIARDQVLDTRNAVKEFFPNGYAVRNSTATSHVTLTDLEKSDFIMKGKEKFLQEARSLAKFGDVPGIVRVKDFFEENSTAYIVMDYLEGIDLRARIRNELFRADELFRLMEPLFDALGKIHESGLIHRDISPDNIMMKKDGTLTLMDFGAARVANYKNQHSMSVLLKSGYAPIEQYNTNGQQGPWTDIYALSATIYKCITGITPPNSLQRRADFMTGNADPLKMPSEMGIEITPAQENMLKRGLSILSKDRPQNIRELKVLLDPETEVIPQVMVPQEPDILPAKLFVVYNHSDWEFDLEGEQSLGRASTGISPDLDLNIPSVSRRHGVFCSDNEEKKYSYIPDEASTNGTRLNGSLMEPGEEVSLSSGDILTIRPQKMSRQYEVTMIFSTSYAKGTEWRYIGISGDTQEIIMGMQSVSRMRRGSFDVRYASLFFVNGECVIIDHGNTDIYVNNRKIDQIQYLETMDVISVRGYDLVYTGQSLMYQTETSAPYLSQIVARERKNTGEDRSFFSVRVEERNLWKRFKKNTVFRNYNIQVDQGSLVLIMGGTDILEGIIHDTDLNEEVSSQLRIPENPDLEQAYRKMRNGITYVSQNDHFPPDSRVFDLISQSVMKTGLKRGTEQHSTRVMEILRLFHLDLFLNRNAGELKYTQRRILSVAVEYAKGPSLMYVDYPDSGLDRRMAGQMVQMLRRIANQGKVVLTTSNRPDLEAMLYDQVFVLGKNAETGERILEFAGTRNDALRYFRTGSLEEILPKVFAKNARRRY